jgi:hypothetical protein
VGLARMIPQARASRGPAASATPVLPPAVDADVPASSSSPAESPRSL